MKIIKIIDRGECTQFSVTFPLHTLSLCFCSKTNVHFETPNVK